MRIWRRGGRGFKKREEKTLRWGQETERKRKEEIYSKKKFFYTFFVGEYGMDALLAKWNDGGRRKSEGRPQQSEEKNREEVREREKEGRNEGAGGHGTRKAWGAFSRTPKYRGVHLGSDIKSSPLMQLHSGSPWFSSVDVFFSLPDCSRICSSFVVLAGLIRVGLNHKVSKSVQHCHSSSLSTNNTIAKKIPIKVND